MVLTFEEFVSVGTRVCALRLKPGGGHRLILREYILKIVHETKSSMGSSEFEEFYNVMRLLLPQLDDSRRSYGLKEVMIAKYFNEALSLNVTDFHRLKFFRDPHKVLADVDLHNKVDVKVGNFPSVLYYVIASRLTEGSPEPMTDGDEEAHLLDYKFRLVNECLDQLAVLSDKLPVFQRLVSEFSAKQICWIVKLILKDLEFSIGYETILKMLHPDAGSHYHASGQLYATLQFVYNKFQEALSENREVLSTPSDISLSVRNPKPMLGQRLGVHQLAAWLETQYFKHDKAGIAVEQKLDGERLLTRVSRVDSTDSFTVKVYSRSGNSEYPEMYVPHLVEYFRGDVIAANIKECLLDGEILCWDTLSDSVMPFGHSRTVAGNQVEGCKLYYVVFDILEAVNLQGKRFALEQLPYYRRREILKNTIAKERPKEIEIIKAIHMVRSGAATLIPMAAGFDTLKIIDDRDDAMAFLTEELSTIERERKEGVMLKREDAIYWFNGRNKGWWKLKPKFGWLKDSLDMVILGFYLSSGGDRRRRRVDQKSQIDRRDHVSVFLLGLKKNDTEFRAFTKCGTGYTVEELRDVIDELKPGMIDWADREKQSWTDVCGDWRPAAGEKPDYVILPQNSMVMEITGAEIVPSDAFDTGYTLRFPRAMKGRAFRRDKNWSDVMTCDELQALVINHEPDEGAIDDDDEESDTGSGSPKRKRGSNSAFPSKAKARKVLTKKDILQNYLLGLEDEGIIEEDVFQKQVNFYVLAAPRIVDVVKRFGGVTFRSFIPGRGVHVVAERITDRVLNFNKNHDIIIYRPQFVLDWISEKSEPVKEPRTVLLPDNKLRREWRYRFDVFGDSFTEPINSVAELFDIVNDDQRFEHTCAGDQLEPERAILRGPSKPRLVLAGWNPYQNQYNDFSHFNWWKRTTIDFDALETKQESEKVMKFEPVEEECSQKEPGLVFDWTYIAFAEEPCPRPTVNAVLPPQCRKYLHRFRNMNPVELTARLMVAKSLLDGYSIASESKAGKTIVFHPYGKKHSFPNAEDLWDVMKA